AGEGEAAGAGACASATLPQAIAIIGTNATNAPRKPLNRIILIFSIPIPSGRLFVPADVRKAR
ncbi:hypothetical protein CWO90_28910, partial [Bradyrhizobium sp. Leo121]